MLDVDTLDVVVRLDPAGEDVFHEKRKWMLVSKAWHESVGALLADPFWLRPYHDAAAVFVAGLDTVGDVRSVVAGMRNFRTFPHVQMQACMALSRVDDRDGLREAALNGHMVRVLADALDRHSDVPPLHFQVVIVLTRICVVADTDNSDPTGGCVQLLERILGPQA